MISYFVNCLEVSPGNALCSALEQLHREPAPRASLSPPSNAAALGKLQIFLAGLRVTLRLQEERE